MASRELPLDIALDVLSYLPVKSLSRFKCVSKSWLSLISSPLFIKTHLDKHSCLTNDTRLIFSSMNTNRKFTQCSLTSALCGTETEAAKLDFPTRTQSINIVGNCNGLLCIAVSHQLVGIWNPSIRKYKTLPFDRSLRSSPAPNEISYGFGYDDSNDDYKVVEFCYHWKFTRNFTPTRPTVRVYSSKRNCWRKVKDHVSYVSLPDTDHGIFLKGKIHWIMQNRGSRAQAILTFDLASEKYGEIQLPETLRSRRSFIGGNLGVVRNECLSLSLGRRDNSGILDVWIMPEYGAGEFWTIVATIPLLTKDFVTSSYSKPVLVSKEGEILFICRRNLALYIPEKHWIWNLGINHGIRCGVQCLQVDIYNESMVWFEEEELKEFQRLKI